MFADSAALLLSVYNETMVGVMFIAQFLLAANVRRISAAPTLTCVLLCLNGSLPPLPFLVFVSFLESHFSSLTTLKIRSVQPIIMTLPITIPGSHNEKLPISAITTIPKSQPGKQKNSLTAKTILCLIPPS